MSDTTFLRNHFLIAMPNLLDPNFYHSVTYLCEHDAEGAMGIVINNPLEAQLSELLQHLEIEPARDMPDCALLLGGPVEPERGFVLHRPGTQWQATMAVSPEISITTSRDILHAMAHAQGPDAAFVALGYAGWGPGQLEQEMLDNAWLSVPAEARILFDTPIAQRWHAAAALLGIDIHQLTGASGRA